MYMAGCCEFGGLQWIMRVERMDVKDLRNSGICKTDRHLCKTDTLLLGCFMYILYFLYIFIYLYILWIFLLWQANLLIDFGIDSKQVL